MPLLTLGGNLRDELAEVLTHFIFYDDNAIKTEAISNRECALGNCQILCLNGIE